MPSEANVFLLLIKVKMSIVLTTGLTLHPLSFFLALKLSLLITSCLGGIFSVLDLPALGHGDNTPRFTESTVPIEFLYFSYDLTNIPWLAPCLFHLTARNKNRRNERKTWLMLASSQKLSSAGL